MRRSIALLCFITTNHTLYTSCKDIITFYQKDKPYYEFTNFWIAPISLDGVTWPSVEHYFQAQKFLNTKIKDKVRLLKTCMQTFYFVRRPELQKYIRSDWHLGYKDAVMMRALRAKFSQNKELQELLLATGNALLVSNSHYDYYWADPYYFDSQLKHGRNKLGKMLMHVRKELQTRK